MKRLLITGAGSYIGVSAARYLLRWPDNFEVDTIDMRDGSWRNRSFAGYDAVFHVAGVAHSDARRITPSQKRLYYAVNTDLTIETARKARTDGVRQFIFMSSAIVYGNSAPIGRSKLITRTMLPTPANCYGDSKLQAEKGLLAMNNDHFRVVVLRAPMIYGPDSKGNYPILSKLARKLPAFPRVHNQRSMLYIDNLCEFVRLMILHEEQGVFWPQNATYSNTSELVKLIAQAHGKRLPLLGGMSWALRLLSCVTGLVNKAFGSLAYDMSLSDYPENYRIFTLEESIRITECGRDNIN